MRARGTGLFVRGLLAVGLAVAAEACVGPGDSLAQGGQLAAPQATPAMDPVRESPSDPIWRELWLPIENAPRDGTNATRMVDGFLSARPGLRVADLGAGGGYFAFRLARAVGPSGSVLATDLDERMTRKIAWEAGARGVTNLSVVHSTETDLGLAGRSVDLLLINDAPVLASCDPAVQSSRAEQIADAVVPGGRFVYFSPTPETSPATVCDVPTEAEVRALVAPWFEVTGVDYINEPAPYAWSGFALQLRRREAPAR